MRIRPLCTKLCYNFSLQSIWYQKWAYKNILALHRYNRLVLRGIALNTKRQRSQFMLRQQGLRQPPVLCTQFQGMPSKRFGLELQQGCVAVPLRYAVDGSKRFCQAYPCLSKCAKSARRYFWHISFRLIIPQLAPALDKAQMPPSPQDRRGFLSPLNFQRGACLHGLHYRRHGLL